MAFKIAYMTSVVFPSLSQMGKAIESKGSSMPEMKVMRSFSPFSKHSPTLFSSIFRKASALKL